MHKVQWILGSILSLSGWRLDILLVRVTSFSRVLFFGFACAVSPPAPQLTSGPVVIDTVGEAVESDEDRADVPTGCDRGTR